MYTLYGGGFTRAHMTEMVLTEAGENYTVQVIDTMKGEHRSPAYLKINPAGWTPALRTPQGRILYETPAINLYIAETHSGGVLAPSQDDPDRGEFLSALFYLTDELEPALKRYFFPHRYAVRNSDEAAVRELSLSAVCECLSVIDNRLAASGPFHLGDRYSLPDLMLSYWMCSIMDHDAVAGFTAIKNCRQLVEKRPKIDRLFRDLYARTKAYADLDRRGPTIE